MNIDEELKNPDEEMLECIRNLHRIYRTVDYRLLENVTTHYNSFLERARNDNANFSYNFFYTACRYAPYKKKLLKLGMKTWNLDPYMGKRAIEECCTTQYFHPQSADLLLDFLDAEIAKKEEELAASYEALMNTSLPYDMVTHIMPYLDTVHEEKNIIRKHDNSPNFLHVLNVLNTNDLILHVDPECARLYVNAREDNDDASRGRRRRRMRSRFSWSPEFLQRIRAIVSQDENLMELGKKSPKKSPKKFKAKMSCGCARSSR